MNKFNNNNRINSKLIKFIFIKIIINKQSGSIFKNTFNKIKTENRIINNSSHFLNINFFF